MEFPTNPVINDLPEIIAELNTWCMNYRGFINAIFSEQITMEEKITKLFWCVKKIAESQESVVTGWGDLYNFVYNYFNNLDLQEEVNTKINEMVNDGTLAKIINEDIFSTLYSKDQNFRGQEINNYVVNDFIEVGLTYLANTDKLVYGNTTALNDSMDGSPGAYQIDCSTLVLLMLNGVPYEKSRYALGGDKYNNIPDRPWAQNLYDDSSGDFKRYANMCAETFWNLGQLFNINSDFSNIRSGDILFWIGKETPGSFRNIVHCAVFLNITATNGIRVLESNTGGGDAVRVSVYSISPDLNKTIAYAGRPLFNGIDYSYYKNLIVGNHSVNLSSTDSIWNSLEVIDEGFFTCMIKGTGTGRPTVTLGDSTLTTRYIGNDLYIAYLRVTSGSNELKVRVSSNYTFKLSWVVLIRRFVAYPVPFYLPPNKTGIYVKGTLEEKTLNSNLALIKATSIIGSNYQNTFHLANDGTITAEEGGKYLVSIIAESENDVTYQVVTYAKGEGTPAPIDSFSGRGVSLSTVVNLSSGGRIGVRAKGSGNSSGKIIIVAM